MVETVLASVLTAIVVGALVTVFGYVSNRTAKAYGQSAAVRQASKVADEIASYVGNALDVSLVTVNGQTCLKCTMPSTGRHADGNLRYDLYEPDSIKALSMESFNPGQRVWFYMGDTNGGPIATGAYIHKAVRSDDSGPVSSNVDVPWEKYPGNATRKYPLVTAVAWALDSTYKFVTFTVYASVATGTEKSATAQTASSNRYDVMVTRRVLARNFR